MMVQLAPSLCELDQHQVVFRYHCQLPHHDWTHGKRYRCWLQFLFRNRHSPRIRLRVFVRFLQGCVLPRGTATHHEFVCLTSALFRDFGIFVLRNRWFRNRWVIVIVHGGLNSTSRSGGSAATSGSSVSGNSPDSSSKGSYHERFSSSSACSNKVFSFVVICQLICSATLAFRRHSGATFVTRPR